MNQRFLKCERRGGLSEETVRAWETSESRATMLEEQSWGDRSSLILCSWRIKPKSLGLTWKDICCAEYPGWVVIQSSGTEYYL